MPAVATGAMLANHTLKAIGVSGDGDTASIGLGQFMHMSGATCRSSTSSRTTRVRPHQRPILSHRRRRLESKTGVVNDLPPMDLCALAVELGCGFVARGFAGDPKQMVNILKAAIAHDGMSVIDVISPCVTFNNHEGSTKGYQYSKEHQELLHQIGFVPEYDEITVDYEPGETREVTMHDGSRIVLKKLEEDYDPSEPVQALQRLHRATEAGQMLTGLVHLRPEKKNFIQMLNIGHEPLATLPLERTRPSKEALDKLMRDLM